MRIHWIWALALFGLGVFLGPTVMGMFGKRGG